MCYKSEKGLNKKIVIEISAQKNEPGWMTDFRLKALEIFEQQANANMGCRFICILIPMIFIIISSRSKSSILHGQTIPDEIKNTFDKLGIPQAEQKFLAGVGAQFESEVIYKNLKKEWA